MEDLAAVSVAGEQIRSTKGHPFWVCQGAALDDRPKPEHIADPYDGASISGRWVDAGDLRVGDVLLLGDNRREPVAALELQPYSGKVYNFLVDDLHSYAVGHAQVLVHNNCNSAALGKSLNDNVRARVSGEQAGHIVPAGNWANTNRSPLIKDAIAESQAKINELLPGGINNYKNGFWTSSSRHEGTHTDAYFKEMWDQLKGATTEEQVVSALNKLRDLAASEIF